MRAQTTRLDSNRQMRSLFFLPCECHKQLSIPYYVVCVTGSRYLSIVVLSIPWILLFGSVPFLRPNYSHTTTTCGVSLPAYSTQYSVCIVHLIASIFMDLDHGYLSFKLRRSRILGTSILSNAMATPSIFIHPRAHESG